MRTRYREEKTDTKVNGYNGPFKKKSPEFKPEKQTKKKLLKHNN